MPPMRQQTLWPQSAGAGKAANGHGNPLPKDVTSYHQIRYLRVRSWLWLMVGDLSVVAMHAAARPFVGMAAPAVHSHLPPWWDAPDLPVRPGLTFLAWIGEPLSSEPSASTAKEPVPSIS